jgi:hypothetical protein
MEPRELHVEADSSNPLGIFLVAPSALTALDVCIRSSLRAVRAGSCAVFTVTPCDAIIAVHRSGICASLRVLKDNLQAEGALIRRSDFSFVRQINADVECDFSSTAPCLRIVVQVPVDGTGHLVSLLRVVVAGVRLPQVPFIQVAVSMDNPLVLTTTTRIVTDEYTTPCVIPSWGSSGALFVPQVCNPPLTPFLLPCTCA